MANSNNSVITGKFRGALGKELVFREWEGKTVVAKAPKAREGDAYPCTGGNTGQIPARFTICQGSDQRSGPGYQRRIYRCVETQAKPVQPGDGRFSYLHRWSKSSTPEIIPVSSAARSRSGLWMISA